MTSVHIAHSARAGTIKPETGRALTFGGANSAVIGAGEEITSDPLPCEIRIVGRTARRSAALHSGRCRRVDSHDPLCGRSH
ncbi:MAG: hypothetical protein ACREOG_13045 [Gemmatimonadaceae bacterium]